VTGIRIDARDGAVIADIGMLTVTALDDCEIALVDAA
jgi:quercetin 2,3-dioxygenase